MVENKDSIRLGGEIELVGFKDVDPRSMIVLKKIIGNYVRKFTDHNLGFKSIKISLKAISKKLGHEQYEFKARLDTENKVINSDSEGRNLFIVCDALLKKLEKEISKK